MANEPVGSGVSSSVIDVLKKREEIFAKNNKSIEDLFGISASTGWAKLRSSVGKLVGDPDQLKASIDNCKVITLDNTIAENYILTSGTRSKGFQKPRAGINFDPSTYNQDNAYNMFSNIGPRPMPGITNYSVKSKNTYGTLMEADINIVVWSLQELNDFELIYFRPGYTALFEWGHSVYIKPDGSIGKFPGDAQTVPDSIYFDRRSFDEIDKNVQKKREIGKGSYEGMFGFITNFNWSFREDGGYDVNIKIVSRGVILDNLKMGKPVNYIPSAEISDKEKEKGKRERKSIYHYIFSKLESEESDNQFKAIEKLQEAKANTCAGLLKKGIKLAESFNPDSEIYPDKDFYVFRMNAQIKGTGWLGFFDERINLQYIKLRDFLLIYNTFCTLKDPVNDQGKPEPVVELDYGNKYTFFPELVSIDPLTAVPPTNEGELCITRDDLSQLMKGHVGNRVDDIMNIMISTRMIQTMVDKVVEGPGDTSKGMVEVIKDVLGAINGAFSNLTDLDLHVDHHTNRYIVVDRNVFSSQEAAPVINVTGLKSTITELGVESTISKQVSSQVAIAAQGNTGNVEENLSAILEWNSGAIDRHMEIRRADENKSDADSKEKLEKLVEDITEVYDHFNGKGFWKDQYIDPEFIEQLRGDWAAYTQTQMKLYGLEKGDPPKGVVPVELSLKMLGIGGFKIGQSFGINKGILPTKYNDYSYIITGLEHTYGNGLWWTNLKTQFYAGRKPSNAAQDSASSNYTNSSRAGGAPGSTVQAYPGDQEVPPTNDCTNPEEISPSQAPKSVSGRSGTRRLAAKKAHARLYKGASYVNANSRIGVKSMCARWTYNFAEYYVKELNKQRDTRTGANIPAGGNANQSGYHGKLTNLGYKKTEVLKSVKKSKITNWLSGYNWGYGDIAVYWANDGEGSHRVYGHTCYYMGDAHPTGGIWASSVDYNYNKANANGFIYNSRKSDCWNLLLFTAPRAK